MKLNINNIKSFFDLQRTPPNRLKPGMLYTFEYNADNIHDKHPLIWVLEVKTDRIWGLNLHYDFSILANIITFKEKHLKTFSTKKREEVQKAKLKEEEKEKQPVETLPTIVDAEIKNKNITYPTNMLDDFSDFPIGKNSSLLRNYLYKEIRNAYKLSLKPTR